MISSITISLWSTNSQLPYPLGDWTGRSSWSIFTISIDFKRASFTNRIPILKLQSRSRSRSKTFPEKSVIDFHFTIGSWFSCENQSAILICKSDRDWKPVSELQLQTEREIGSWFSFTNRIPILKLQSRSRSRSKTFPEKSVIDFHFAIGSRFSR